MKVVTPARGAKISHRLTSNALLHHRTNAFPQPRLVCFLALYIRQALVAYLQNRFDILLLRWTLLWLSQQGWSNISGLPDWMRWRRSASD